MTDENKPFILENDLIKQKYFDVGGCMSGNTPLTWYSNLTISKFPCQFFERIFPSSMGRSLLIAELCVPHPLMIANVHLESLNSAATRME